MLQTCRLAYLIRLGNYTSPTLQQTTTLCSLLLYRDTTSCDRVKAADTGHELRQGWSSCRPVWCQHRLDRLRQRLRQPQLPAEPRAVPTQAGHGQERWRQLHE